MVVRSTRVSIGLEECVMCFGGISSDGWMVIRENKVMVVGCCKCGWGTSRFSKFIWWWLESKCQTVQVVDCRIPGRIFNFVKRTECVTLSKGLG